MLIYEFEVHQHEPPGPNANLATTPWKVFTRKASVPADMSAQGWVDALVAKAGCCTVNGRLLRPGDRVVLFGETHPKLPSGMHKNFGSEFQVTLDWDGCDLTEFPESGYAKPGLLRIPVRTREGDKDLDSD